MTKQMSAVLGLCVLALALSSCGKKGPLEPPPGAENTSKLPQTDQIKTQQTVPVENEHSWENPADSSPE